MDESRASTTKLLLGIWSHISHKRRIQLLALLLVMLASGAAELVTLGSVIPFLAVLTDPSFLWEQKYIRSIAIPLGYTDPSQLLIPVIICFAFAAVIAASIRLCNVWLNGILAASIGSDLSCEAYKRTLYQPFTVHVQRNSSEVIAASTSQVKLTVNALNAILQSVTSAVVAIGILIGMLFISAPIAISAFIIFGTAYSLLAFTVNKELRVNSYKIAYATKEQLRALQEGLGSIRDLLLDGSQPTYIDIYRNADRPQRFLEAKNNYLSSFPRFALEALGIVLLAFMGGFMILKRGSASSVIPTLGSLALGSQRLLPALQQLYGGWASVKSCNAGLLGVLNLLNQPLPQLSTKISRFNFTGLIELRDLSFRYNTHSKLVLSNINFEIKFGQRIGFIGSTGCGKSTLADVIMGLLPPTSGNIYVDGIDINHDPDKCMINSWRASIAHVPQSIYLADTTIAENIAFGVPKHLIDWSRVYSASQQAQISPFVESMEAGYNSLIGEGGIRLSGGQKQRIGIARALYKQATVLVFDEATSALDTDTENAVMEAINNLSTDYTIILIAQTSTVAVVTRLFS